MEGKAHESLHENHNEGNGDSFNEDLTVGYFIYNALSIAKKARSEQERITKLEEQVNYNNPKLVYALYNKILEGDYFNTPEGYLYLVHLQTYLYDNEAKLPGDIKPIPYKDKGAELEAQYAEERARLLNKVRTLESEKAKAYRNIKVRNKKTDNFIYKLVIGGLSLVIIIMIIISLLSGGPTILNYKTEIQNEYAEWEQKLNDKEKQLNDREKQIKERENQINQGEN